MMKLIRYSLFKVKVDLRIFSDCRMFHQVTKTRSSSMVALMN